MDAATATDVVAEAAMVDAAPATDATDSAATATDVPTAPAGPTIAYVPGEESLQVSGFPALSEDGATLITTVSGHAPGTGARLVVQLRDARTGAVRRALVVVSPADSQAMFGGGATPAVEARVRARMAAAMAALQPLHAHALQSVETEQSEQDAPPDTDAVYTGSGAGLSLRVSGGQITLRRGDATGPVVVQRPLPPMAGVEAGCRGVNTPRVETFFPIAANRLLVKVGYVGNDRCWEGPDTWLVLAAP